MQPDPTKDLAPSTSILSALDKAQDEMKRPPNVISREQVLAEQILIAMTAHDNHPAGGLVPIACRMAKELCERYRQ